MTQKISGRTALVTGASGGIGRATAIRLAEAGAHVLVHYAQGEDRAAETVRQIRDRGGEATPVKADLTDLATIPPLIDACNGSIDILVNNAGVARDGRLADTDLDAFDTVFATNVRGTFFLTQAVLPHIPDGGAIINISSMVSIAAYPAIIAYAMSKAAINSFTRSLAADLGERKIRVNAVAPGATDTALLSPIRDIPEAMAGLNAITAFGRLGTPDEIANVVAFLASPEGSWITGQVIQASGGMHL